MVAPLVVLALAWDKLGAKGRDRLRGKERQISLGSRSLTVTTLDLLAAAMFSVMGLALIVIGITGTTVAPTAQVALGTWLQDRLVPLVAWLEPVPDVVIGLVLIAFAVAAIAISGRRRELTTDDDPSSDRSCHDEHEETIETVGHTDQDPH